MRLVRAGAAILVLALVVPAKEVSAHRLLPAALCRAADGCETLNTKERISDYTFVRVVLLCNTLHFLGVRTLHVLWCPPAAVQP